MPRRYLEGRNQLGVMRGNLDAQRYIDEVLKPVARPFATNHGTGFVFVGDKTHPSSDRHKLGPLTTAFWQVWFFRGRIARNRVIWGSWRLAYDLAIFSLRLSQNIVRRLVQQSYFGSLIMTCVFWAAIVWVITEQVFYLVENPKFSRERILAKSNGSSLLSLRPKIV